jgi:hypothetical protein
MLICTHPRTALHHALVLAMLLTGFCACSDSQSPEAQVRTVIAAMQSAAEARDASDLMEFVAADFRSAEGQSFPDMERYLVGYLLAHQRIHLLTRIEQLEFPIPGEAHVRLSVGMAGKAVVGGTWELAADIQELDLVLREDAGQWQVVYAAKR